MKFETNDTLMKTLREDVDIYFNETGLDRRDQPAMWFKAVAILVWYFASYALLVFGGFSLPISLLLAVSLGLATSGVGFNVMHDGGHSAFSKSAAANRWLFRTLDMVGASSYIWKHKHNSAHHSYTNIAGHDDDLDTNGLIRMSPDQPYRRFYRFQHLYAWALYAFLVPKWIIYDDYAVLKAGKVGETPIKMPQGAEMGVFIGGKVFAYTLAFVIPMFFYPVWLVLAFYLLVNAVTGVTLATVFQLAHVIEETSFPQTQGEAVGNTFARHQLQTTADFAPRNKLLTWYVGGLNFQVEHHLFPRIAHTHYPALAKIVRKRAEEAGIPHLSHKSLRAAIAAHYRHLRTLGQPALVPA